MIDLSIQTVPVLLFVLGFFSLGALFSLILGRNGSLVRLLGLGFCILGSLAGIVAGVLPLLGQASNPLTIAVLPFVGSLSFHLDSLSGLFVAMISLVSTAVCIYSFSYILEYESKGYSLGRLLFLINIFVLSMILVVTAQNGLLFMVFWEIMAMSSFFLVIYEQKSEAVKSAGLLYLIIAHVGAAFLIMMFLAFAGASGSFDFSSFSHGNFTPLLANVIFVFALLGFGSKAGIIPLHVWLPQAHPQAPSNISALMSGVMLKVAIYGLIRVLFDFLGGFGIPTSWGVLVLVLGMMSSLLGVLYALGQRDIKRLLAMSSIENIGIIFLSLGAALLLHSIGQNALASVALFAALFHSLNHAFFKSLLFMGAGAVAHVTHTRDMEKLGGLVKLMPLTAVLFFIGALSISAVPPFNGFASEWVTFQVLITAALGSGPLTLLFGLSAVALAITGALALAVFVESFGIVFLGMPRTHSASEAKEVPSTMLLGMGLMAVFCILAGVFPIYTSTFISAAVSSTVLSDTHLIPANLSTLPNFEILILLALFAGLALLVYFISKTLFGNPNETKITWDCGFYQVTPRMQYGAIGFSMPVRRVFAKLTNPFDKSSVGLSFDVFDDLIYQPINRVFLHVSSLTRLVHTGQLSTYLFYLVFTLLGILIYAVFLM
ncbi:hydrogenase 4 subunit B [Candidatus Micrarchaeota archaeon]|nr:hydrogenase 4 subunit B [Candidatus Micrarchaeota archaeon]